MTSCTKPSWGYRVLTALLTPIVLARLWWRGRAEPLYRHHWWQRLGWYGQEAPADTGRLWIHAVSLGETRAAGVLIQALRQRRPALRILLTHGTATGCAEGRRWLRADDVQVWLPWDSAGACHRFMQHFRPRVGLLLETEVWPNLIAAARTHQVPVCLVNARLSERTLHKAQRWPGLSRVAYGGLTAVWAQTAADAQRLQRLHAQVAGVMGNLKFDATPPEALLAKGRGWRDRLQDGRPVVVLASSRDGEEALWLQALSEHPDARSIRWLIVPRHPQRFDDVARQLAAAGLGVSRRSAWPDAVHQVGWDRVRDADVLLGDTLGEMAAYYAMADWALLGGSFMPYGGQNLIEAIACDCPVVLGPHVFNFQEAADAATAAGLAHPVADMNEAVRLSLRWSTNPSLPAALRERVVPWLAEHRGAAGRLIGGLEQARLLPVHKTDETYE